MDTVENLIKSLLFNLKKSKTDSNHKFDIDSKQCKNCKDFLVCKQFADMSNKITSANIDERIKHECLFVLCCFKLEFTLNSEFNIEEIINADNDSISINDFHKRFEFLKDFNHFDVLLNILDEEDIKCLRKIITDINNNIHSLTDKILVDNLKEMNEIFKVLQKPKQEEKSYEDMTREELLEELKKKK